MNKKVKVAVIGVSGYTGIELIRLLINHPFVEITSLVANSSAGKELSEIYPHLRGVNLPIITTFEEANLKNVDVFFLCLPHTKSHEVALKLPENAKVIDLSADFRLHNTEAYEFWYKHEHIAKQLQKKAVYGLSEVNRSFIKNANLIACPGCYATSMLLPLIPLVKQDLIDSSSIIVDAKSGITGAGKNLVESNLFAQSNENFRAYSVKEGHRHLGEVTEQLEVFSYNKKQVNIIFTPYVLPINRGILSTIYVDSKKPARDLKNTLIDFYKNEKFVKILPHDSLPSLRNVATTNMCEINVIQAYNSNKVIIFSALDNLLKGASGQAMQNFNIIMGFSEDLGLKATAVFI